MALPSGTKLGPYEIQSPLGAGGMGEVYKARDTRLERTVAIKVLSQLSDNPDLKQRFEREAKTISSLQHPHICVLHDVGSEGSVDFLVMEYLEGETLADRLRKGALPLEPALKIASEIAEALDKAHRQGIVHRDLKPGNIMLTKSGAKLMDFGLAKPRLAVAAGAGGNVTSSTPTMSMKSLTAPASLLTQKGTIVGTFQYMAPEVLQGTEAEACSDIFSFGCVLYEMITGRRAFEGKSQISVLAAILEKEPEPVSILQPLVPLTLDHIIRACLAKDPEGRIASAHDLKLELEWLASRAPVAAVPAEKQKIGRERAVWTVLALVLIASTAYFAGNGRQPAVIRSSILPPKGATLDAPNSPGSFAVSPNGGAVVFSAVVGGVDRLYLRRLRENDAIALAGTEDGRYPFWSPDGNQIGFFTNHQMKRMDLRGGPPVTLCEAANGRGGAWAQDGNIYFVPATTTGLMRVPESGGTPTIVLTVDQPRHDSYRWPVLLPDGKHLVLFAGSHSDTSNDHAEIVWASTGGREQHVLLHSTSNAAYAGGYLLFTRGATLMAQKLDPKSGKLSGDPEVVVEGLQLDPSTWRASFATNTSGMVLTYIGGGTANATRLVWLDQAGKPVKDMTAPEVPASIRFSRAGTKLLIVAGQPRSSVWVTDLTRNVTTPFTFEQDHQSAVWSPDGRYIAYCERGGNARYFSIWAKAVSGTDPPKHLLDAGGDDCPSDWSPDGKTLAFQRNRDSQQIWLLPLGGRGAYPLFDSFEPDVFYGYPVFSPDGKWLAYVEGHQGRNIVEVTSFPTGKGKWQVSTVDNAFLPFWSGDGRELFYVSENNDLISSRVDGSGTEFRVGATRTVAHLPLASPTGAMQTIDGSPNGKGFAAVLRRGDASASLTMVQNFTKELKK